MKRKKGVRMLAWKRRTWNRERSMKKRTLSMMKMLHMRRKKVCSCLVPVRPAVCIQPDAKQATSPTLICLLHWVPPHEAAMQAVINVPCMA